MLRRVLFAAVLALAACSHPRPVVYPDERYKAGGEEAAKADADLCLKEAKAYLKANPAKRVAGRTARGGVFGAFMGMVFGAFTGNYRRAVAEGAAVGAAAGLAHGAWEAGSPDEIQRAYTQRCMAEKGWSVIGWK
ncbi:MAG: cell envelope biogenesis protein OmpA [Elusimicrobia bacterium]|nr:cell envelope biogenesis protein OmpA [Elusimicrobiota bacterium]